VICLFSYKIKKYN